MPDAGTTQLFQLQQITFPPIHIPVNPSFQNSSPILYPSSGRVHDTSLAADMNDRNTTHSLVEKKRDWFLCYPSKPFPAEKKGSTVHETCALSTTYTPETAIYSILTKYVPLAGTMTVSISCCTWMTAETTVPAIRIFWGDAD